MPYKDREKQLAYLREYSIRRSRAQGRPPFGSDEHRERISASARKGWEKRRRVDQNGENNPNWRDDATGNGIHTWLRKNFTKTGVCSQCGKEGKTDRAFLRHPDPYTRDIADYAELCRSCHVRKDRARRAELQTLELT